MLGQLLDNPALLVEVGNTLLFIWASIGIAIASILTLVMVVASTQRQPWRRVNHPIGLIQTGPPKSHETPEQTRKVELYAKMRWVGVSCPDGLIQTGPPSM